MEIADVAWTAGIVDGEGHIGIERYGGKTTYGINVGNTDRRMLEKLRDLWGGNICFNARPDRPRSKPFWVWYIKGRKNALPCIVNIYPYLVCKHDKAKEIIEYSRKRWGVI